MATGTQNLTLQTLGVVPIDDRDPTISYSPTGNWQHGGKYPEFHNTTTGGKNSFQAEFAFIGTSIAVYGTFGSEGTAAPPSSTYTIDNGAYVGTSTGQIQNPPIHNQIFYQSPDLEDGDHSLVITGEALDQSRFWLDYILYMPSPDSSPTSPPSLGGPPVTPLPTSLATTSSPKSLNSAIIGGVFGGLVLLGLVIAMVFSCRRRSAKLHRARMAFSYADPPPPYAFPQSQYRIDYSIHKSRQGPSRDSSNSAEGATSDDHGIIRESRQSVFSYDPPSSAGMDPPVQEPAVPSSVIRISRSDTRGTGSRHYTSSSSRYSRSTTPDPAATLLSPSTDSTFSNIYLPYDDPLAMRYRGI